MTKKALFIASPIGTLLLAEKNGKICDIAPKERRARKDFILEKTPLLLEAEKQLSQYFKGERKKFDLPLLLEGTPFQIKIWQNLIKIPYGQTVSYAELAENAGSKKAARAAGNANNKNPILIAVPCHRVIGADGKLSGFACGTDKKKFLLALELYFKD